MPGGRPLGKRLSRIFRREETNDNRISNNQQTATDPVILSTIHEDDEQAFIAAATASLQDENARLEAQALNHASQISEYERAVSQSAQEIDYLNRLLSSRNAENQSVLNQLQESHSVEVSQLNERLQTISVQLRSIQEQKTQFEQENAALQERKTQFEKENAALQNNYRALHVSNQEYKTWVGRARAKFAEQSQKIQNLEQQVAVALEPMDQTSQRTYNDRLNLLRTREELEATFNAEKIVTAQEIEDLKNSLVSKEQDNTNLQSQLSLVQSELEEERTQNKEAKVIIQALEVDRDGMIGELGDLSSSQLRLQSLFGGNLTPRLVLVLIMFSAQFPRLRTNEDLSSPRFLQTYKAEDLESGLFDIPLEQGRLDNFLDSITPGTPGNASLQGLSFSRCPACKTFKFSVSSPNVRNKILNEFPSRFRQTSCCSSTVCSACLIRSLKTSLANDWWYELGSQSWLKCPIERCGMSIGIRRADEIANILRDFGEQDIQLYISMFERALVLRQALASLDPRPSSDELSVSSSLHKQLVAFGLMYDFFSDRFNNNIPDEDGRVRAFDPGKVLIGSLDRGELAIPIFMKFFRRSTTPKDCSVCAESLYEVNIGSEEHWRQACEGYHGSWMSKVLLFPTRDVLHCDHDMDMCKGCLETQLSTQLKEFGRNACGRLTCPSCNRVLSENEVHCFGSEETVQTYDHYLLLNHLSSDPNFRWCLRNTCKNGQLYEDAEYMDPRVVCDECAFEMCFTHQIPWHEGMSCDQYDSQREHGDPEYQQTQSWLRSNSKNCPRVGCGVNIVKDAGCFHMTCRACRHEFCWECLADWSQINTSPGNYVQGAHNDGCWFRSHNLQPTQINGNDLQEALRRRG